MDTTKVWTAQHVWVYLHAIIDCCTSEIVAFNVKLRSRTDESLACVNAAIAQRPIPPGALMLGTDNGTPFRSRRFRQHLSALGISHRRGGYRDPESQAFIKSWFGQFKKRCAWRAEWETINHARHEIGGYVHTCNQRRHSGLAYLTPADVAQTWRTISKPATRKRQPPRGPRHQELLRE